MAKITNPAINGSGKRKCNSWIDAFINHTDNLESASIWRKWSAISTIASVLERKVWVTTSSPLYANLYVFLVGDAGLGKTRPIMSAMGFIQEIPEIHLGFTSMTMAALTDCLAEAKRFLPNFGGEPLEYNSLTIIADELSAFMKEYDKDLIPGLTTFYDCVPYSQGRRVGDIRIKIKAPQLNILSGTTQSNLLHFIPEYAWEQGFTSRCILVYSEDKPIIDVFNTPFRPIPDDMVHDLKTIYALSGQFGWTKEWAEAMHNWKTINDPELAGPKHPKLKHYGSRRFAHMIKLSMIASVDRSNKLELTKEDFNKAMGWLLEAEQFMPDIFKGGSQSPDSQAIDEILHFVQRAGAKGVPEHMIVNYARLHVQYSNNVMKVLEIMERSGHIEASAPDSKTGLRHFRACIASTPALEPPQQTVPSSQV